MIYFPGPGVSKEAFFVSFVTFVLFPAPILNPIVDLMKDWVSYASGPGV